MSYATSRSASDLEALVAPVCRAHGMELVQVRKLTERGRAVLRVLIDRAVSDGEPPGDGSSSSSSGVTLADCTAVSRDLSTVFDLHSDLLPSAYHLEVSSPGVERPLVRPRDYQRFRGREAKVQTHAPVDGRRRFRGKLLGFDSGAVRLEEEGHEVVIPLDQINRAHLVHRF